MLPCPPDTPPSPVRVIFPSDEVIWETLLIVIPSLEPPPVVPPVPLRLMLPIPVLITVLLLISIPIVDEALPLPIPRKLPPLVLIIAVLIFRTPPPVLSASALRVTFPP